MPNLDQALAWIGFRVEDVYGARIGRLEDVYVDSDSGAPTWILVRMARFSELHALIPLQDAVAGLGHVWVPYEKDLVRGAPKVTVGTAVAQKRELALCAHYGVMSSRGSAIEGVPSTAATALPSVKSVETHDGGFNPAYN